MTTSNDHSSEGNAGQIHDVVMGFAPALWVFSHLNNQLRADGPPEQTAHITKTLRPNGTTNPPARHL